MRSWKKYFFEVLSATDYSPKVLYQIILTKLINTGKKNKALKAYGDEIIKTKTSRNLNGVMNLAMYREFLRTSVCRSISINKGNR